MKLSNPLTRKWKWNFTALSFAFPCVGMLVVMLISGYIPFGKTSMLYSDMYHQYYPFFVEFRRVLRSGGSLVYNWSLGLGVDFRFSDCVSFGVELNTNMLSDKYNSKKAGNLDWQFNALAGFTFRFGKNYKKSRPAVAAAPVTPARTTEPAQKEEPAVQEPAPVQVPVTKAAEKPAALRENIFFRIGSAQIRTSEQAKVAALAEYLKANPSARIEIVGYADAATGSHAINLKLSRQRAAGVAAALEQAGIAADRISAEGRGDTVQPFPGVEQNRVSICIAQ